MNRCVGSGSVSGAVGKGRIGVRLSGLDEYTHPEKTEYEVFRRILHWMATIWRG